MSSHKDAPLAPELMRTRTLAIRVAGRVGERFGDIQVPATAEDDDEDEDVNEEILESVFHNDLYVLLLQYPADS